MSEEVKHDPECPGKWLVVEDWMTPNRKKFYVPCRGECVDLR